MGTTNWFIALLILGEGGEGGEGDLKGRLGRGIYFSTKIVQSVACKQALWGTLTLAWEKEGEFATMSLEFEYPHQEILIGGDDISNDIITLGTWFSTFVYILTHFCSNSC